MLAPFYFTFGFSQQSTYVLRACKTCMAVGGTLAPGESSLFILKLCAQNMITTLTFHKILSGWSEVVYTCMIVCVGR